MGQGVSRFEDLIAWQKARILTRAIDYTTRRGAFARDFSLSRQIQRAAVSVISNVAEGFERNNPGEFHQFLSVAKGSCAELRSELYVAFGAQYLEEDEFDRLLTCAEEVSRIIGGLRSTVEHRRDMLRKIT